MTIFSVQDKDDVARIEDHLRQVNSHAVTVHSERLTEDECHQLSTAVQERMRRESVERLRRCLGLVSEPGIADLVVSATNGQLSNRLPGVIREEVRRLGLDGADASQEPAAAPP